MSEFKKMPMVWTNIDGVIGSLMLSWWQAADTASDWCWHHIKLKVVAADVASNTVYAY